MCTGAGTGLDACAAIQVPVELAEGEEREIVFRLGAGGRRGIDDTSEVVQRRLSRPGRTANSVRPAA